MADFKPLTPETVREADFSFHSFSRLTEEDKAGMIRYMTESIAELIGRSQKKLGDEVPDYADGICSIRRKYTGTMHHFAYIVTSDEISAYECPSRESAMEFREQFTNSLPVTHLISLRTVRPEDN